MNVRISWHMLALVALFAAAVVAAVLELGPPSSSARTAREVITAADGLVQTTVTGTGNVEAGTDVEASFQASGVLQHIYVKDGDHVVKGQLLATLDPTAAQLTLDQAQESLTAAEDQLTNAEDQQSSASSSSTSTTAASTEVTGSQAEFVAYRPAASSTTAAATSTTPATTSSSTGTTPSQTRSAGASGSKGTSSGASGSSSGSSSGSGGSGSSGSSSASGTSGSSGGGAATTSAETLAANVASAQASVDSAEASVTNAENSLHETHLYAPASGTVVNVEDISPGDTVSGGGSSSSSNSGSNSSSGGSGSSTGGSGSSSAGSLGSSSSSTSSSSGVVEIVNTHTLTMTVALSESDVSKVKVGQPATVTLEALTGVELGAHVSSISTLGSSSSGVVSYDATLTLDQSDAQVKPGMSASASIITKQASGVNLPNSAVTGTSGSVARVNVLKNGQTVSTPVVVGVVGDSRTQIVSGLSAGQQVVVTATLPSLSSSATSGSSSSGTLGTSRFGGGGGGAFFGGGGGARLGGGGGFAGGGAALRGG